MSTPKPFGRLLRAALVVLGALVGADLRGQAPPAPPTMPPAGGGSSAPGTAPLPPVVPPTAPPTPPAPPVVSLPSELRVRVGRLARLEAKSTGRVAWLNLHAEVDLIPDSSGTFATVLVHSPGTFKIAAYTGSTNGPSEPALCDLIASGPVPPAPIPPAPIPPVPIPPTPPTPRKPEPAAAIGRIRFGSSGCTATVVAQRAAGSPWEAITAAHCVSAVGAKGTMTLPSGRTFVIRCTARNPNADLAWLAVEAPPSDPLPFAVISDASPAPGVRVWHAGYGVDRPGNREDGECVSGPDGKGQCAYSLSVSSGDSGGGIFNAETGEWLGAVCCTAGLSRKARMWAGGPLAARALRPASTGTPEAQDWVPLPIPILGDPASSSETARAGCCSRTARLVSAAYHPWN